MTAESLQPSSSGGHAIVARFSTLLCACLCLYIPVLWLTFAGTTSDVHARTVGFASLLALLLAGTVLATRRLPIGPLMLLLTGRTVLSYLVPFWYVLFQADPAPFFWGRMFTADEFDHGFAYLILFSTVFAIAILTGNAVVSRQRKAPKQRGPWHVSADLARNATLLLVAICAVDVVVYYTLGVGRYTDIEHSYAFLIFSNLVWPPETIVLLFFVMLAMAPTRRSLILVGSAAYFICATATGSKGGPYYLLLFWLYAALSTERDPRLQLRTLAFVGVLAAVLSAGTLYVGNYVKQATRMATVATGDVAVGVGDIVEYAESRPLDTESALQIPVRRNSELEQLLTVSNDPVACANNLSWMGTLKSAIDRILPGTYFDEIPTERIYAVCYRGFDEDQQFYGEIRQNDKWGLPPLLYAYSGFGLSLVVTALVGVLVGLGFAGLLVLGSPLWLAWGYFTFDTLYEAFGFDFVIANQIPIAIQLFVYLLAVQGLSTVLARWRTAPEARPPMMPPEPLGAEPR